MRLKIAIALVAFVGDVHAFDAPQYDKSTPASDDTRIVGMFCDPQSQSVEVGYFTAYNLPKTKMDLWNTFDLKKNTKDGGYVESVHEVVRECNLAKDRYLVKIRPVPGNRNLNGECGGVTYGGAKILKNGHLLFDGNFEECNSKNIVVRVKISRGKQPVITKITREDYYK